MAKLADTWMPLYVGDYLADTGHLSAAEHGAYLLLLFHYWRSAKPLPADDAQLRRIARMDPDEWARSRDTLAAFFRASKSEWRHKRVDTELSKANKRSRDARAKAEKKWGKKPGADPEEDAGVDATGYAAADATADAAASNQQAEMGGKTDATKDAEPHAERMLDRCSSPSPSPSPSDPPPLPEAAGRMDGAWSSPEARRIVDEFLRLRLEKWPNESGLASPTMTLGAQAASWLQAGAPPDLCIEVMSRVMDQYRERGDPNAPHNLNFCRKSMETAIRNHLLAIPDMLKRSKPDAGATAKDPDWFAAVNEAWDVDRPLAKRIQAAADAGDHAERDRLVAEWRARKAA